MGNRGLPPLMEYFSEMNYPAASSGVLNPTANKGKIHEIARITAWYSRNFSFLIFQFSFNQRIPRERLLRHTWRKHVA
jgi:hypothetical protein